MRFGRKKRAITALFVIYVIYIVPTNIRIALIGAGGIGIVFLCIFLILNKAVKRTNWWRNNFVFTRQFVSNKGYRNNLIRNLKICNVGSNPARFAFHYENIMGENWSTGTQGLDMDLEILKFNHSYLCKGACVLLSIVPFSSVSGYLDNRGKTKKSLAKFSEALDSLQMQRLPMFRNISIYKRFPLFYEWRALGHLVCDEDQDCRLLISENPMQRIQMEQDAYEWMRLWKEEFDIKDFHTPLPVWLQEGRRRSLEAMGKMVEFLLERDYRPILISPPVSSSLSKHFTSDVKETYIYSFTKEITTRYHIQYLDYTDDSTLQPPELYFNALFLNLRGRKLFTRRVLKDLEIQ